MPRTASLALLLLAVGSAAADYPTHTLKTDQLTVTVYEPDAKAGLYRGARFDWSGVCTVTFGKHKLFGPWLGEPTPKNPDSIVGPCEEFGMFTPPPGYEAAKVGDTFLKIGVGELEKPKEDGYRFLHGYKITKPGGWVTVGEDDRVTFTQSVRTAAGYGYRYAKTLTTKGGTLTIDHTLENTSTKPLATDHYNHNFFNVDADPVGPNYELEFPFAPTAKEPKDRFAEVVKLDGKKLTLSAVLDKGTLHAGLTGFDATAATAGVTMRHKPTGVTVRVTGDRPLARFNVWAMKTTLCPEPFVELKIEPGKSVSWRWKYEFAKK